MNLSRLPAPITQQWDWQLYAACRGVSAEMFFCPDAERGARKRAREKLAKSICAQCPVITECRDHSLKVREPYGVWGGLSEADRAEMLAAEESELRPAS